MDYAVGIWKVMKVLEFLAKLGASLFEIAQSLFALERTCILGPMALNKKKSKIAASELTKSNF